MKHPFVAIVVLVAFLMQGMVAISYATENISIPDPASNTAGITDDVLPAPVASADGEEATTRTSAIPLTPEEQAALTAKEGTDATEVMNQTAGREECYEVGAGQVRCKNYTKHPNFNAGIIGGLGGAVIGLLGGAAGAAIGAVAGFTIFYTMNWWTNSEQ